MPDTATSWFHITMLHIWIILIRVSTQNPETEFFKQEIIKRMREDLKMRTSKLGVCF